MFFYVVRHLDSIASYLSTGLHLYKGKIRPRTGHEDPYEECRCSSTLPLTSALMRVCVFGQCHAPADLPPGKNPVPIVMEATWGPEPVWKRA